jgi:hypothetical protein
MKRLKEIEIGLLNIQEEMLYQNRKALSLLSEAAGLMDSSVTRTRAERYWYPQIENAITDGKWFSIMASIAEIQEFLEDTAE